MLMGLLGGEKGALKRLFEVNRRVLAEHKDIPVTTFNTLLGVALWGYEKGSRDEPLTMQELGERIGQPYTTVAHHLRYLGQGELRRDGLGLVETSTYVLNRRQKVVKLTAKGRALVEQLAFLVGITIPQGSPPDANLSTDKG